jgi:hypothetical protein
MDKLENTWSRVRCIRSMCQSFWPLILKQTVILTAMSNDFPSYMQIIGQWPMPNGNLATPRQPSCTVSRKHNWTDCGRLGPMLCSRILLRTVLELIGRNPGMLFAVRLDVWTVLHLTVTIGSSTKSMPHIPNICVKRPLAVEWCS